MLDFWKMAFAATVITAAAALPLAPAQAAVCMKREELVSYLTSKFQETPRAVGLVANRGVMEVYVAEAGTWTIVITSVSGTACIVAAGDTWDEVEVAGLLGPEA
jgi:hypothetical protein